MDNNTHDGAISPKDGLASEAYYRIMEKLGYKARLGVAPKPLGQYHSTSHYTKMRHEITGDPSPGDIIVENLYHDILDALCGHSAVADLDIRAWYTEHSLEFEASFSTLDKGDLDDVGPLGGSGTICDTPTYTFSADGTGIRGALFEALKLTTSSDKELVDTNNHYWEVFTASSIYKMGRIPDEEVDLQRPMVAALPVYSRQGADNMVVLRKCGQTEPLAYVVCEERVEECDTPHKGRFLSNHMVNGLNEELTITVLDESGAGGANHEYAINWAGMQNPVRISFQNGPIKENGVNGISNEALLAILIDRMEGFQSGQFACHDNQMALDHMQSARLWLAKRTMDRVARGVEGSNKQ